jgi:hypothetical protein
VLSVLWWRAEFAMGRVCCNMMFDFTYHLLGAKASSSLKYVMAQD